MTVRKRRDRGWWEFYFDLPRDPDGRRRRVRKGGFPTKRAAEEAEAAARVEYAGGFDARDADATLGQYLEAWLPAHASLKPSTAVRYEQLIRVHITPAIGQVPLRKLRPFDVKSLMATIAAKGLAASTCRQVYAVLHVALEHAYREELLRENPAARVPAPHVEPAETYTPTIEEVGRLLCAGDKRPQGPYFRFIALTGMRRGEGLALHWEHVDFERGGVSVRGSVRRIKSLGGVVRMTPKRERSVRYLVLSKPALDLLRHQRWRVLREKEDLGADYRDQGIVFAGPFGDYQDPDHVSRVWAAVAEECGLPQVRLHDLRHALATRMLERGVHMKVVQEILGHSSYTTTANIYAHVEQGLQTEAIGTIAGILGELGFGGTND